ncbi:pickpocket protein 28-like [Chironomus tepperi]|uniref:pickpocket protein 28-like n=1 Tax=Chironomus tepperi TaxID=113505 RepID=UPI00391F29EA
MCTKKIVFKYGVCVHGFKPNEPLNLSIQEQNYLASNIHTCMPTLAFLAKRHTKERTSNNIVKLLNDSFLTINETLMNCAYKEVLSDCSVFINRVLTDRGFCYTFNLMGFNTIFNDKTISEDFHSYKRRTIVKSMDIFHPLSSEKVDDKADFHKWSLDKGYDKYHDADSVPVKAEKLKSFSVNLVMRESDIPNICMATGRVFSFYIHLPNEMMLPTHQEYFVEFRKKADVLLTAKSYTANEGIRKFEPRYRGCYFEGEKQLKFFKTYTKSHCEFECMTNYTLNVCGCVRFSMPRSSSTPVCTIDNAECANDMMSKWPDYERFNDRFEATCGCLKTCNDLKYDVKFEKTSTSDNVLLIFSMYNFSKGDAVSRINFMFDDFEILEYEEYAAYSLHNFVADVGGLLGFFLGCSILSIIEIVYFIIETCLGKFKYRFIKQRKNGSKKNAIQTISREINDLVMIETSKGATHQKMFNPTRFHKRKAKIQSIKTIY